MAKKTAPKHNDEMFRKTFEEGFKKHFQNGLLQGSRAICKVVYDKACDEKKTVEERIEDIKKFCSVLVGLPVVAKGEEVSDEKAEPNPRPIE